MAEYDQLDTLTGHSHSLSGVPMRPKKQPTVDDAIAKMAAALAESQASLTQQLANALTSRPGVESPAPKGEPRRVRIACERNATGAITGGTVTNGETTWDMTVSPGLGGRIALDFTPR
jgi:hypothetical protein